MKRYSLALYSQSHEVLYNPVTASQLARVSLEFLEECEREGLVRSQRMLHGEQGFSMAEIHQLARIRRLCDTLAVDLAAVEVILHLRQQVLEMLAQLNRLEERMSDREQELRSEIQSLHHRIAEEIQWNNDVES